MMSHEHGPSFEQQYNNPEYGIVVGQLRTLFEQAIKEHNEAPHLRMFTIVGGSESGLHEPLARFRLMDAVQAASDLGSSNNSDHTLDVALPVRDMNPHHPELPATTDYFLAYVPSEDITEKIGLVVSAEHATEELIMLDGWIPNFYSRVLTSEPIPVRKES